MSQSLNNLTDTTCLRTTMNFTLAVSPAFVIDGKTHVYTHDSLTCITII